MQLLQRKVLYSTAFIAIDVARQLGQDIQEVVRHRRRTYPQFGEPDEWHPSLPVNEGFTTDDADIFIEFFPRVGHWQEKTPQPEQKEMLAKYTSFNAMVRDLVRQGKL